MKMLRRLFGRRKPAASAHVPDTMQELGRNDPCWCGSGKKYKKCHSVEDAKRLAEARDRVGGAVCDAFS
ncbi:SEC-C metal-binding domain-containing protein [Desulfuromonas sp.]|uniref:SEC-C metal-binding domain-containing protein n=1 Tax=Desulfuromonas sp. TaxID=892 RepID=UPI0025C21227|nr:SEC-C metal-binding domain-containing protein [Desulfuromonas sp.]